MNPVRLLRRVWRDAYQMERARRALERGRCAAPACILPARHSGDHLPAPELPSGTSPERIVTVYSDNGRYLGAMSSETWERLLESAADEIFVGKSTQ